MNRFYHGKKEHPMRSMLCSLLIFFGCAGLVTYGMDSMSSRSLAEQKQNLEDAVWRGVTQCYAVEGRYPEDLEYLQTEYGLQYDSDTFFVDYQVIGSNMLPDITIIER